MKRRSLSLFAVGRKPRVKQGANDSIALALMLSEMIRVKQSEVLLGSEQQDDSDIDPLIQAQTGINKSMNLV